MFADDLSRIEFRESAVRVGPMNIPNRISRGMKEQYFGEDAGWSGYRRVHTDKDAWQRFHRDESRAFAGF